jgi:hypothetical protein
MALRQIGTADAQRSLEGLAARSANEELRLAAAALSPTAR